MKILGIEQSTAQNSIAVLEDSELLAQVSWDGKAARNQEFFSRVDVMLLSLLVGLEDIDVFSVGLGPGSFTGIRIALSAANAMARPGAGKVLGVSSGEAIAKAVMDESGVSSIAVVGDARRERFWSASFASGDVDLCVTSDYRLIPKDEIGDVVKDVELVVSPEWDRIGSDLSSVAPGRCIEENRYPDAVSCAALAFARQGSVSDDVPLPIYLHPAVVDRSKQ